MRRRSDRERNEPASVRAGRKVWELAATAIVFWVGGGFPAWTDDFGRLEGPRFFELPGRSDARKAGSIGLRDLEAVPAVLHDERAALVLVKTDDGNLAKLLVSAAFRKVKPSEKDSALVPVLVLERFETVDAGDRRSIKARGKDVMLFDGFQFDLDTGCVVPEGLGGDILFKARGQDGPRLVGAGQVQLVTLEKPIPTPAPAPGEPSSGRAVQSTDFAGRYYLIANGQWSGLLELAVDAGGAVTGHFRSDKNGSSYDVKGAVSADVPHKVQFSVQFPRAQQTYEGLLWTEGKNALAGTLSMLERPYGFVAIREGSSLAAGTVLLTAKSTASATTHDRIVVMEAGSDRYTLDGKALSASELADALTIGLKASPATKVVVRVPESVPFERVHRVARLIEGTGVSSIRVALAGEKD
jgi:biopolymer transport protein ExbD